MRRYWSIVAVLGLGLCTLAVLAVGCGRERDREVRVIHERPQREVRVEREREVKVERDRRGHERDREDRRHEQEREHD
jgi:hypothetical protein